MIPRVIEQSITEALSKDKIIIILGARQVGKTTLLKKVINKSKLSYLIVDGDIRDYHSSFNAGSLERIKEIIGSNQLLFIDEAQGLPNIGINLKLIHDYLPDVKILVSGSSYFDLSNKIIEPLTGRAMTFHLYPVSLEELAINATPFEIKQKISQYMIYGLYPEILTTSGSDAKRHLLEELTNAYLYKDVIQLTNIKNSGKIHNLLKLIALQIGSLVSMHELGKQLSMSSETVSSYIDLLEKAFVVKRISGFSRNPRKEISKIDKIYFLDLGVRNAIINDFRNLESRQDVGAMWENFVIMERLKYIKYHRMYANSFFWRKYSGAEIDYLEVKDNQVKGFEIKWGTKKSRSGNSFLSDYPKATYNIINRENFLGFLIQNQP